MSDRELKAGTVGGSTGSESVTYRVSPFVTSDEINELFAAARERPGRRNFGPILRRSLTYVCAYQRDHLAGFVNVAWDGGVHAFLLDTTVHPDLRRRGIGRGLVVRAAGEARARGIEWLHVDFEPGLRAFYEECGFRDTQAGLLRLGDGEG